MCLIIFAYRAVPGCPLLVAANRDEWFSRPAIAADFWPDQPKVLAGRDLQAGGTWLGISTRGKFAALTNFRNPSEKRLDAPSRGELVSAFLTGSSSARAYMDQLAAKGAAYNGFTLLAGDAAGLFCYSNKEGTLIEVEPGIHGLSNHLLDTPWPKVVKGRSGVEALLNRPFKAQDYLDFMDDSVPAQEQSAQPPDAQQEWERKLSSMRIMKGSYGTRCSTALLWSEQAESQFAERTYNQDGSVKGEVVYRFTVG